MHYGILQRKKRNDNERLRYRLYWLSFSGHITVLSRVYKPNIVKGDKKVLLIIISTIIFVLYIKKQKAEKGDDFSWKPIILQMGIGVLIFGFFYFGFIAINDMQ